MVIDAFLAPRQPAQPQQQQFQMVAYPPGTQPNYPAAPQAGYPQIAHQLPPQMPPQMFPQHPNAPPMETKSSDPLSQYPDANKSVPGHAYSAPPY